MADAALRKLCRIDDDRFSGGGQPPQCFYEGSIEVFRAVKGTKSGTGVIEPIIAGPPEEKSIVLATVNPHKWGVKDHNGETALIKISSGKRMGSRKILRQRRALRMSEPL